jgi:hypothetical protein
MVMRTHLTVCPAPLAVPCVAWPLLLKRRRLPPRRRNLFLPQPRTAGVLSDIVHVGIRAWLLLLSGWVFGAGSGALAGTATSVGGAMSEPGADNGTFSSLADAWAGDQGTDRALRAFIVFDLSHDLPLIEQATAAMLSLSQVSTTFDNSLPDGPPLDVNLFSGRTSSAIDISTVSTLWAEQPVATYSYAYPVPVGATVFSLDVLPGLRAADINATSPFLWISIELSNPATWFPAPNRNFVAFNASPTSHSLMIVPEPSACTTAIVGLAGGLYAMRRRNRSTE